MRSRFPLELVIDNLRSFQPCAQGTESARRKVRWQEESREERTRGRREEKLEIRREGGGQKRKSKSPPLQTRKEEAAAARLGAVTFSYFNGLQNA